MKNTVWKKRMLAVWLSTAMLISPCIRPVAADMDFKDELSEDVKDDFINEVIEEDDFETEIFETEGDQIDIYETLVGDGIDEESMLESEVETVDKFEADADVRGFITRLYKTCLNRKPDEIGMKYWIELLESKAQSGAEAASGFVFSNEFKALNLCNSCFVESLYECMMGRRSDKTGKTWWLSRLETGFTRGEVFNGFVTSVEFGKICDDYGIERGSGNWASYNHFLSGDCSKCGAKNKTVDQFITRLYQVCLDRNPDSSGFTYWRDKLVNGSAGAELAYGFIFSNEFKNMSLCDDHFLDYMYKAFFDRRPDAEGKAHWLKLMKTNTKGTIFNGFIGSAEFRKLCYAYGIKSGTQSYGNRDFKMTGPCNVCGSTVAQKEPVKVHQVHILYPNVGFNFGTNHPDNPAYYDSDKSVVLKDPTRDGYIFGGWYYDTECKKPVVNNTLGATDAETVILTAKWTKITPETCPKHEWTEVKTSKYYPEVSHTEKVVTEKEAYKPVYTIKDVCLFCHEDLAKIKDPEFGYALHADDAHGSYGTHQCLAGYDHVQEKTESRTIVDMPARTDNIVTGYKCKVCGGTKDSDKGAGYVITFTGNVSDAKGSMKTMKCEYGKSYTMPKNTITKPGYVFDGWNTKADGSGKTYKDGADVKNLANKEGTVVVMYAQWKPTEFKIKLDGNGATSGTMKDVTATSGVEGKLPANTYKRDGYRFFGFGTKPDGMIMMTKKEMMTDYCRFEYLDEAPYIMNSDQDVTLYAQWAPCAYGIIYDYNGGDYTPDWNDGWWISLSDRTLDMYLFGSEYKVNCTNGETYANATRKGYTLVSYNTKPDGSGEDFPLDEDGNITFKNLVTEHMGRITLYAQWEKE